MLVNPANAAQTETTLRDLQAAARAMGLQIQVLNASTRQEIDAAFATFVRERPDALFVGSDTFFTSRRVQIVDAGGAPRDPRDISEPRIDRSRRPDELRKQHYGCVSPIRRLCRSHPQGCEAGGPAGHAVEQVRAGHQHPDRHDARPHRAADAARHRRRSNRVNKREFITLLGGTATWPFAARAQQPAKQVVGYLSARSASTDVPMLAALNQGLAEIGFIEGQNVVIERRWGEGQFNRLPAHATDLVQQQVAVIVAAGGETVARIAKQATSTIPIVFIGSGDPVQSGLVASINRPGGNITGVNMLLFTLTTKQLGLLRELVPTCKTVALMVNPNQPELELQTSEAQEAARATGQQLVVLKVSTEADIDSGFATLVERRADALLVVASPFLMVSAPKIIAYSARHSVPTLYFRREFPEAGGLLSYGSSTAESYRQAGVYAGRILKGAKPADLPVIEPVKFELVINLKTAKTLGLTIPPGVLAIADEVIE